MTKLLLVHGAFHGGWCWDRLIPELAARGLDARAVDLPFTTPEADRETVAAAIDSLAASGEPVVAVGHSFGGAGLTAAAGGADGRRAASHLVYLTALMHEPGQTPDLGETPGLAALRLEGETASVDPDGAVTAFYHRCAPEDAAWATAQLRPMPMAVLAAPLPDHVAWRHIPSTYVVCTDDQIIAPARQRDMAAHAGRVVEIDSDHSPFLARPGQLAAILDGVIGGVVGGVV